MLEIPPDITFYVQIAAFLVFALVLQSLIWAPTQKVLAEREHKTTGAQAEALLKREEAAAMRERLAAALEEARHSGSSAGDQVRRDAEQTERHLLEEAKAESAQLLESMRSRVAAETDVARQALRQQIGTIAQSAAEKILGRSVTR
jgi:F-type H+-transporting ATPase subunit b